MPVIDRKTRRNARLAAWLGAVAAGVATGAAIQAVWGSPLGWLAVGAALIAGHTWMVRPGGVPVLVYHSVSDDQQWLPWAPHIAIGTRLFARHMDILARMKVNVIPTGELVAARRAGRPLADRSCVIHFDDGYLDNRVAALPVLRRHGFHATLFVSLDFIAAGERLRPTLQDVEEGKARADELQWRGYLNWSEIADLQHSGLFDIQAHGIDHARVPSGPAVAGRLTPANWRNVAWVQWAATPGDKSRWYEESTPTAVPLGSEVPRSHAALTAPAWLGDRLETPQEYEERALDHLRRARLELGERLGRSVDIFCWPQNVTNPRARELAARAGYTATTAARGENRPEEDPAVISRLHIGDKVLGWRCEPADALYFRAQIKVGHGNYYWSILLLLANLSRRLVVALFGEKGKAVP